MEASEYKLLHDDPRIFRRGELVSTRRHLGDLLPTASLSLACLLEAAPIEKPRLHSGSADSDLFRVPIPLAEAREICDVLQDAEAGAVSMEGKTTALASEIGSLVDRWTRYAESLEGEHNNPMKRTGLRPPLVARYVRLASVSLGQCRRRKL